MRYAIYFAAAADDPLMELGNTWLGRDPFSGSELRQPSFSGLDAKELGKLTSSPRRYGFHGTLKAPFHLSSETSEAALLETCSNFASRIAPFDIMGLSVSRLGSFLALTPDRDEPDLSAFASACVRHFEKFRAPLTGKDLERRRQSNLTPAQDAYLVEWGYPYIFEEFRFHMTLSNKLNGEEEANLLAATAETHFQAVTGRRRTCRTFALYIEPERGAPFEAHTVFELTGTRRPHDAETLTGRLTSEETA